MEQAPTNKKITLVTGLWDIKRSDLDGHWARDFEEHYIERFRELLKVPYNLIVFGDKELRDVVFETRSHDNTVFIERTTDWFRNEFFDSIQKIRNNPDWYNQAGWLPDSTQARLEMYNPLVMSKMFLLNDARIFDPFESAYLYWIDAGLTNTVHIGYFTHDKVIDNFAPERFMFVAFPYDGTVEIHGFTYSDMCRYAGQSVNKVMRGGFFGGPKESIEAANNMYYHLVNSTLSEGLMGTEESLFTLLCYVSPSLFEYYIIEPTGLINRFFEDLKNGSQVARTEVGTSNVRVGGPYKTSLYVITFNSPAQFHNLVKSMVAYDTDFLDKPRKILLDNSTDLSTTPDYKQMCEEYGFEHVKKDNIGIVGGRMWIAEHFEESDSDYMFFFEDDMNLHNTGGLCRNGFNRYTQNLYQKSLEIVRENSLDFLKLSFSEFFGDNTVQWAWYNVPQDVRERVWPDNSTLPKHGLSKEAPLTKIQHIKSHKGVPYALGDIYYCNWPQIVAKKGNYKMFLETRWAHPFEQTHMSYIFQETLKGRIKPGLLLMSPIEHHRFDHYDASLRKES